MQPPPPFPMTPPPYPPHHERSEEGGGGWIGYAVGGMFIIIGILFTLVMIYFMVIFSGLTDVPVPLSKMLTGPLTMIFFGVLFIVLWYKRDVIIAWWERLFRGKQH